MHNALNFRDDYLYTLNVPANARKLFPCFDQPDLKAAFDLKLTLPEDWKAVSAGSIEQTEKRPDNKDVEYYFETAENIPTYLFSFVAGKFEEYVDSRDGFEIRGLYRETDPEKVAQMPQIMDQVRHSVKWMEEYTGIPFPFPKLDFVIIPGYQFGGMEHIGAIQFNDKRIFLEKNPTQDQLLSRAELIAHEVSHMWFGDLVTMKWFDDVWTKEVFANYMASMIVAEQFPDINHNLNFIRNYHISALEEDRTDGSHPIAQRLDNLKDAGLLYGNIIYKKAPIVMRKLHQLMGDEPFRTGLQKYLKKFSYSNATWDDLIDILSDEAPDANLKAFSQSWVKERGCPTIFSDLSNGVLTVTQKDIQGTKAYRKLLSDITGIEQTERDIVWPQTIDNHIYYNPHSLGWHILYD
ncbi:MAG: aminopeptidase, partial [Bacteroidales bacterium]|nr:aminopeptidase [Bacteroidales bacterium]